MQLSQRYLDVNYLKRKKKKKKRVRRNQVRTSIKTELSNGVTNIIFPSPSSPSHQLPTLFEIGASFEIQCNKKKNSVADLESDRQTIRS